MNSNILIVGCRQTGKTTKICELLDKSKSNYDDIMIITNYGNGHMYKDKFSGINNICLIDDEIDDEMLIKYIKCNISKKKLIISDDYILDKRTLDYIFSHSKSMNVTYWNGIQYCLSKNMKCYDVVIQTSHHDVYDKHKIEFLHKN